MILMATAWPSRWSMALYTAPYEPSPILALSEKNSVGSMKLMVRLMCVATAHC